MIDSWTRRLRQFIEVARVHSISKAARSLGVSQQALSKCVSDLESEFGIPLFDRGPTGVELTDFGRFFLKRAKMAVKASDYVKASATDWEASVEQRTILVGVTSYCLTEHGGTLSPAGIHSLRELYPQTNFGVVETTSSQIRSRLVDGTLQFGVDELSYGQHLNHMPLKHFQTMVLVSEDNPVCNKGFADLADLARGTIAVASGEFGAPSLLERLAKDARVSLTFSPTHVLSVDPSDSIVDRDTFVVMSEQHALRTVKRDGFVLLPLQDAQHEQVCVDLCLMWRKDFPLGKAARGLIDYVVACYQESPSDSMDGEVEPDE